MTATNKGNGDTGNDAMKAAWLKWCDTLTQVPELIDKLGVVDNPRIQAEGYRYLARLTNMALERGFESKDSDFPRLLYCQGPARKIGGDCPDAIYRDCALNGNGAYRVSGLRGNAASLIFTITRHPLIVARDKSSSITASIKGSELKFQTDGSFELVLGGEPQAHNWLPLGEESDRLIIRQFFGAAAVPKPAQLSIERIDSQPTPSLWLPGNVEQALLTAIGFLGYIPDFWANEMQRLYEAPNHIARLPPELQARNQALPGGTPLWGSYRLTQGEVLLIEFTPPQCEYWSLLCGGHWFESHDYRQQVCHINMDQADYDEDGVVRIILAHDDPGAANWLETNGNQKGFLLLRYIGAENAPEPSCRVIHRETIKQQLPPTTRFVSSDERVRERMLRRHYSDCQLAGI